MAERSGNGTTPLVRIFGRPGSATAYAIRDYLHRSDVPFEWVQLVSDEQARSQAGVDHLQDSRLPVCVFADGSRIECPTVRQITEKLGWFRTPSRSEYDLAIYGAGPAGLSAAVSGSSEGLKTVLIERSAIGGQAGTSIMERAPAKLSSQKTSTSLSLAEATRPDRRLCTSQTLPAPPPRDSLT